MTENTAPAAETVVVTRRPLWQRILKWVGIALLALAVLVLVIVAGINTDPGRRFVADQIGGYSTASGLNGYSPMCFLVRITDRSGLPRYVRAGIP